MKAGVDVPNRLEFQRASASWAEDRVSEHCGQPWESKLGPMDRGAAPRPRDLLPGAIPLAERAKRSAGTVETWGFAMTRAARRPHGGIA